jgi:hypothetical protein
MNVQGEGDGSYPLLLFSFTSQDTFTPSIPDTVSYPRIWSIRIYIKVVLGELAFLIKRKEKKQDPLPYGRGDGSLTWALGLFNSSML